MDIGRILKNLYPKSLKKSLIGFNKPKKKKFVMQSIFQISPPDASFLVMLPESGLLCGM